MPIMQQETQIRHCHFAIAKMSWTIYQVVTEDAKMWSEKSKQGKFKAKTTERIRISWDSFSCVLFGK
jgi:hypothetical protein